MRYQNAYARGRGALRFLSFGDAARTVSAVVTLVSTLLFFNRVIDTHILPMINFLTESDQHH